MKKVEIRQEPTMYFIGVTTARSSIMKVFPLWMRELGREDVVIRGIDLKLHDDAENYRAAVSQIKSDPLSLGALVTTHKINLYEACHDMFGFLDPYAITCGEISSISKKGSVLAGHAKDPITAGLSLDALLGQSYFGRFGGDVLCLGAGGSTTAIILHFAQKRNAADKPRRIVVINRSRGRVQRLKAMVEPLRSGIQFEYHCSNELVFNNNVLSSMPAYSLIINATGMGKDSPGSPLTDDAMFPMNGIAWELNYRGELEFLRQALAQSASRKLTVEDGWLYFLYGWTEVISEVLGLRIEHDLFLRLASVARTVSTPVLPERVVAGNGIAV